MNEEEKEAIRENFHQLVNVTRNIDDTTSGTREKIRNIYQMIQDRGQGAFVCLLSVLRETQNFEAEALLTKTNFKTDNRSADDRASSCLSLRGNFLSDSEVKKQIENTCLDNEQHNPSGTYNMRANFRGHALIINIYKTERMNDRIGSEVDEANLNKLFENLGYTVDSHRDLTEGEMKDVIRSFASNPDLAFVDSSAVIIMCHGNELGPGDHRIKLFTADGKFVSSDYVIEQFLSEECQLTKNEERKPKLFFFIACCVAEDYLDDPNRKVNMTGVNKDDPPVSDSDFSDSYTSDSDTSDSVVSFRNDSSDNNFSDSGCAISDNNSSGSYTSDSIVSYQSNFLDSNSSDSNSPKCLNNNKTHRKYQDLFVIYSTSPGCPSFRDRENGTWFVDIFCKIFEKYSPKYDFCTLIEMTDKILSEKKSETYGYQSVVISKTGVDQKLYFF